VLLIVVGLAAYAATCIMVGSDAYKLRLGELKRSSLVLSSTERSSPGAWLAGCLLVWIVFFPLYLAWRLKLARAARQTIEGRLYMNDEQIGEAKRKEHRRAFVWLAVVALLVLLLVGVCVAVSR
jgi:Ca2+/Na+ antiporter